MVFKTLLLLINNLKCSSFIFYKINLFIYFFYDFEHFEIVLNFFESIFYFKYFNIRDKVKWIEKIII